MSRGGTIAVGGAVGLVLGILASVATDIPLAPEAGLAIGLLVAWMTSS